MRIGTFLPGLDLDTARFECQLPETIVSAAERTDKRTASKVGPGACLAARGRNRGRSIRALLAPWIVAVAVLFTASADEAAAHTGAGAGANDPVNIPDANLRARVEAALGKASGETITHAEMAGLTTCRRTNMPGCLNTQGAYADRNNAARAITDLRGLDHATGLTRLVLSNNPIRNLAPIAGLTSLTELTLVRGRVSDLTPIAGLTNLERLHLSNNQINSSQLRHLTGLSSLKRLGLSGNRITSLTSLSGLTGLTHLSLYRNEITSLSPLSGLTNLIDLLLDYNDITDIEPLRQMTALSLLRLEGNRRLRDISPLSGLTSLSRLDLDVTGIEDIQPLVDNAGLASGDTIDLRDNPHLNAAAGHIATLRGRGVRVFANENRVVQNVRVVPRIRQLRVTWDSLTDYNPQGYKVQWRSGDQDYSDTASPARHHIVSGAGTTSYTIPDLIPGTEYTVRVRADNGDDYGGPPSDETTGTPKAPPSPPGQVAGVTVAPGVESLIVSWTAVTDAHGYKVQWKSGGQDYDATTRQGRVSGADTTSDTIPDLIPGTEYTVRVIATKAGSADGPPSDETTGTPLAPPPGQVAGVTVTPGVESLIVSWTAVTDAHGYKVQWKSGGQDYDATTRQGRVSGADTTSDTIPGLIPGTEYTVRVIATKAGSADGPPSDEATGTPLAPLPPPGQVAGVTVTPGVESLIVSWTAVTDAHGYKVQWKSGGQDYDATTRQGRVSGADTTSDTIPDLIPGTEYTVRVIATKAGSADGPPSDEATGTPLAPPPGQVTGVTVTPGVESLIVSWTAVTDANGYKVQWKSGGQDYDATTRQGRASGADTPSYTIPGLIPGTEYTVRVIATKTGTANGPPSAEATGTPLAPPSPPLPPPGQVAGVTVTPGVESLIVSWTAVTDAHGYKVQWKSGGQDYDATTRQGRVSGADTTSDTIPDLIPGTEYTVRVIATKAGTADGPPSDEATGTPLAPLSGQVTGVTVTPGVESLIVSWTAVTDANGYKVQWKSGGQDYDATTRQGRVSGADTTSDTIPDLIPGTEYTVRVIATKAGTADGPPSDEATGIPLALALEPPLAPLSGQVTGVTVTPGVESLIVSWTAVTDANGYKVQWKSGGQDYDATTRQGRVSGADTTSDTIPDLIPGTEYTVRVIATKAGTADGPPSDEATGTPLAPLSGQVTGVTVTPGVESLIVSWTAVTDAHGYKVQWKSGGQDYDATTRQGRVSGADTTSDTIPDLIPGTEYTVRVIATKAGSADGPPSDEATGTPLAPPPGQVAGVTVTPGVESLIVSWTAVTDAHGYKVQWKSGGQDYDATTRQGRVSGADTTSDTIPDLIPGTEYTVRVIATKAGSADGPPSDETTGTPLAPPPGQVAGVTVTPGVESLIVSWTAVTDAHGYKVQWKSGGQDYDATTRQGRVSGADTTSDTIPGLIPGTEYTVRVIATKAGSADGPPSDEATGTPLAPPPGQVAGVTVTPGVESLIVSWTAVTDAHGYKVQWKSGGQDYDATTRQGRVSGADTTSDTIPGLIPGTEYTVRVIATKAGTADGPPSDEATGTPLAPPPGQVAGVTVTPGVESLIVSWTAVTDAHGYKVQWKSGGQDYDATTRQGRVSGADTTSDTIPDLIPGTEYTVRVIATKAGTADGPPSDEATGTPLAPPPGQVAGVTVTPGVESLIVSWTAVTDAHGYKVQWKSGGQDYDATTRQGRVSGADTTSDTIPGLIPGTEYTVRVIATKAGTADGPPSAEATGAPARRVTVSIARNAAAVEGAAVEFPIRLDGPSMVMVTLTWATEGGTAQPGEDFHAVATGSLTLRPGDRAGTLRVRTLDDRRVEPAETFRVRLTGATNADVDPRAASRTGTITDNDTETARRRALSMVLAGMGRRIAADTVDVVEERFNRPPAGAQVILGGRALTDAVTGAGTGLVRGIRDADRPGLEPLGATAPGGGSPAGYEHGPRDDRFDRDSPAEANEWMTWTPGEGFRRASALELLSRSRFDLSPGRQDDTGAADWSLWGRGTAGRFEGKPETGFGMDGEVFGGYVGLDYRLDRDVLLGVAVAHTRGDADYEIDAVAAGVVDLELTSVLPYAHWKPGPDLGVWALLGTGQGEVELKDEAGRVETDLEMLTVAFGLRQEVVTWQGIDVAFKADAFLTELETAAARELPEATGKARRLRLRLEGRTQWEISDVSQMTPSLEIGGRWDGGDAETGLGMEVAGGLAYAHTRLGLEVEAQGRFLLAHRKTAFDEYGGSLTVKLDPGQAGRGLWLAFAPGWGAEGSRVTQIWDGTEVLPSDRSGDDTPGLSPDRLDLDAGYGVVTHGGAGRLTPYAGLSIAGAHAAAKLGVRQEVGDRMELSIEGRRSMRAETGHEVMLYGRLRW